MVQTKWLTIQEIVGMVKLTPLGWVEIVGSSSGSYDYLLTVKLPQRNSELLYQVLKGNGCLETRYWKIR